MMHSNGKVELWTREVKQQYRIHLLGLVHLPVSKRYMGCAFTQKVVKMSQMLLDLGHEVYLYGSSGSDAPCTRFIETHTISDIRQEWGDGDNRFDIGYDWKTGQFRHDFNEEKTATTQKYYANAIMHINSLKRDDDFLFISQGVYQLPIHDGVNMFLPCEYGIGYSGAFARWRAYESASLMNFLFGSVSPHQSVDGAYYWRVIPNYFDAEDFPFESEKEDYYFYIGRMITRKGVWTAIDATKAIGAKLVLAGQLSPEITLEDIKANPHCEFVGYVEPDTRARLMGKAKGVFVPTIYLEAFGGVNVEAQLCGTPVITTNFGVFPETVRHGETGFLCNTMADFVQAALKVDQLDPVKVRRHAERYLTENVKWEYQQWLDDLYSVYLSAYDPDKKDHGWPYIPEELKNV